MRSVVRDYSGNYMNTTAEEKVVQQALSDVDLVNNPPHYTAGSIECLDGIESALGDDGFQSYLRGNIIKYIWRLKHKGGVQDAEKAEFYLKRLIKSMKESNKTG
jgi:hypothetical protein